MQLSGQNRRLQLQPHRAGTSSLRGCLPCHQQRGSRGLRRPVAQPGRSHTASQATSWLLEGPTAAAQDVGELLLRRWMGVSDEGHLPVYEETAPVRDTDCLVTMCATLVAAGHRKHVLLAFVITDAAQRSTTRRPGSSGFQVADLPQPVLHWGCVPAQGERWHEPPPGWSTWPDVSNDARHGAWQTPFCEQELPGVGTALTLLLQLPWEGPLRHGGMSFLIKTRSNKWLGNADTFKDFFFQTSMLPEMPLVSSPGAAASSGEYSGIVGPEKTLDADRLSKAPPAPAPRASSRQQRRHNEHSDNHQHHQQQHHGHGHGQEPELPNAGRREKEPANDETQVCTLSAAELRAAAATQLSAWMQQQQDLEVLPGGLEVVQHEFPVRGHPSTPFAVATVTMLQRSDGSGSDAREPVLLVAALADIGTTGTRRPGLVLQWAAAASAAAGSGQPHAEADLPGGCKTLPDMSWDAGAGFWDTPMSRHLFEGGDMQAMGQLERSGSPGSAGSSSGAQAMQQSAEPGNMYMALLRLPLKGAFRTGGLLLSLRTARRQWIRHNDTGGLFFVNTTAQLGLLQPPEPSGSTATPAQQLPALQTPDPASSTQGSAQRSTTVPGAVTPADVEKHKALIAAGLSESEIVSLSAGLAPAEPAPATSSSSTTGSSSSSCGSSNGPAGTLTGLRSPERINAALSSADQEMQAHIAAQSLSAQLERSRSSSRAGSRQGASLGDSSSTSRSGNAVQDGRLSPSKQDLMRFLRDFEAEGFPAEDMLWGLQGEAAVHSDAADVPELPPNQHIIHRLAEAEHKARRSLMHRYNIAADMVQELLPDLRAAAQAAPESLTWPLRSGGSGMAAKGVVAMSGLVAVTVWLRFSSLRLLTWNHNYNVKPREISAALDRLGASLVEVYEACPQLSGLALLALASAGRGGEGDMGQRIRDEILAIQQRNNCKGGMMEEWHQKLHNNSSPDDLAICQALLDYLAAGQDLQVYWASLAKEGITPERLASFDRPIRSPPPTFSPQQVPGLTDDLVAYRRTLAAVHSGADLSAAIDGVLGYDAGECKGKRVKVEPLTAVATPKLQQLLGALLMLVQSGSSAGSNGAGSGSKVTAMVEMDRCLKLQSLVVQARHCLAPALRGGNNACQGRLRDVLFLDLALEMTGKGALEAGLAAVRSAAPSTLLGGLLALLQQPLSAACLSALPGQGGSAALVSVAGQLAMLSQDCPGLDATAKARHALSLMERLRSALSALSASASALLQPTANSLAGALGVSSQGSTGPVALLAEEIVRGSAAAALSLLLTAVEPSLRRLAGVSAWSVVSRLPSTVTGSLSPLMPCLSQLPPGALSTPTILVLQRLAGEEEVPPGVVAVVVLGDCPDVLSHCAVRARNCKIPVVACPSSEQAQASHVTSLAGKRVTLSIKGDEVTLVEVPAEEPAPAAAAASTTSELPKAKADKTAAAPKDTPVAKPTLTAAPASAWEGEWVLTLDKFAPGAVGQKAMSTTNLHKAAAAAATAAASAAACPAPSPASKKGGAFSFLGSFGGFGSKASSSNRSSSNTGVLQQLPDWLQLPASAALPHGSFEAALRAPLNRDAAAEIQVLIACIAAVAVEQPGNADACAAELDEIRALVRQLRVPPGLLHSLQLKLPQLLAAKSTLGASSNGSSSNGSGHASVDWDKVWDAVKGVWASQWNSRAVAALGKAGLPLQHLRMGVLLQPLLPARYSWVAHTVNPATGSEDEVCVQLVVGLGEVLVGNHPGRALGGIVSRKALRAALGSSTGGNSLPMPKEKDLLAAVDVVSFPSKDAAIVPDGLLLPSCGSSASSNGGGWSSGAPAVFMARSDSNAEDLPGFAGAGLFDSIPSAPTRAHLINYTKEPMAFDKAAAAALLWQCAMAAVAAEDVLGQQQQAAAAAGSSGSSGLDVEGCITVDGAMWVVQARPQV